VLTNVTPFSANVSANFADKQWSLIWYSSLTDSGHGVVIIIIIIIIIIINCTILSSGSSGYEDFSVFWGSQALCSLVKVNQYFRKK
jgi:hypothetical protein